MWKRRRSPEAPTHPFPPELLAEAKTTRGGWVYSIDAAYAAVHLEHQPLGPHLG